MQHHTANFSGVISFPNKMIPLSLIEVGQHLLLLRVLTAIVIDAQSKRKMKSS